MKNKLTIAILSAMTVAGVQQLNAKTFVPYHPEKAELGTTINPSDYYNFTPTSSYSLDVVATADATIKVADVNFNGFLYTTSAAGTYRFVVKGSNIDVYCNGSYVGQTTVGKLEESTKIDFPKDVFGERVLAEGADEEFPEYIWSVVDSQDAQTGIYSPLNILKNPGFEEVESYLNEEESRYIPTFWTADDAAGFNTGNSRANVLELADWGGNLENAEGTAAIMWHAYGEQPSFYQIVERSKISANKVYRVQFTNWSHGDTHTGSYVASVGTTMGGSEITSYSWNQPSDAWTLVNHEFVFNAGDLKADDEVYFTITRGGKVISHFDRMTMVEALDVPDLAGLTVQGVSSVKFEEGSYAPVIILGEDDVLDLTAYIQNPNVDSNAGWLGTNSTNSGEQFEGATNNIYLDAYNGGAPLEYNCYQNLADLKIGVYRMEIAARTNDDTFILYAASSAGEFSTPIINEGSAVANGALGNGWNLHTIENIKVIDGTLTIGGKGTASKNGSWLSMDEFRLYYVSEMGDDDIVNALAEHLVTYAKEVSNSAYNAFMSSSLPDSRYNQIEALVEEANALAASATKTQAQIETMSAQLTKASEYITAISEITGKIKVVISDIEAGYINEAPEQFTDPVGEALGVVEELLRNDSRTIAQMEEAYAEFKTLYDRAYSVMIPYAKLEEAINDLRSLISICENNVVKGELESLQESASTVFNNEESTADDYANMANSLFKYVMNIYKGYESEDFTNELLNPGCDAESGSVVPDGWDIDKGNGNTYTGASQHYTVLLYESGSDEYTAAAANRYLDSWNGTAGSLIYTATSKFIPMEKGLHILKAVVRANGTGAYIFANTTEVEIPNFGDKDGDHGYGWNNIEVPFVVTEDMVDQEVPFGVKTVKGWTGTWFSADDFEVHHYPALAALSGISGVEVADDVKVYVVDGKIVVTGAENFTVVSVEGRILSPKAQLSTGVYYVVVEGKTYPVFVKY